MTAQLTKTIWARSQQRGAALLRLLAPASDANRQPLAWPKLTTLAHRTALKPLHHRLSAQPHERQQRRRLHERLRHRFRLPRLSLFTVELPDGGSDR